MKKLQSSYFGSARLHKAGLLAASAVALSLLSANTAVACSIPMHNKSGVTLVVNLTYYDSGENVVSQSSVEIGDGQSYTFVPDAANASVKVEVLENGESLGCGFLSDEASTRCTLDNYSNQPICKNAPGPGEITLIRNDRNCP